MDTLIDSQTFDKQTSGQIDIFNADWQTDWLTCESADRRMDKQRKEPFLYINCKGWYIKENLKKQKKQKNKTQYDFFVTIAFCYESYLPTVFISYWQFKKLVIFST